MKETINLPFNEGEIPIISSDGNDGFSRIHKWEHDLKSILEDMLSAVEDGKSLGYFDSLIDIETHCNLIKMLRNKYVDITNSTYDLPLKTFGNYNIEQVEEQNHGGYSTELFERLVKALIK